MSKISFQLILFFLPVITLAAPDTTKIPKKWKHESIIVLEHIYHAEETSAMDNAKFKETQKTTYYIRDKYGLEQLSTFNITTHLVPGAEVQIGKIYKKDNKVIELTTKHLIPMKTKIDFGNRKKDRTTRYRDDGQKLAIPSLEVGDILEIEYTSYRKDFINYLYLSVNYPTLYSESHVSINGNYSNGFTSYKINMEFKAVNFPTDQVEVTPYTISVKRENVDKVVNETLSDDAKIYPYIILWKHFTDESKTSSFDSEKKISFVEMKDEVLKTEQLKFNKQIFENDLSQQYSAKYLSVLMKKRHPIVKDTLEFMNDLFYMYREMIGMKSLIDQNAEGEYSSDRYFVNVMSRVLFDKKIPFKVFVTQAEYYGPPNSDKELIYPKYGIWSERHSYFLFNPFVYAFPNQIPAYFEDQTFIAFNSNPYFYPFGSKKKYCKYGFVSGTLPHSTSSENETHVNLIIDKIDLKKQTCNLDVKFHYYGKNKNRVSKNICSKTLLYEGADNDYRKLVKKEFPTYISVSADSTKHGKFLKKFMLDDIKNDGYDPTVLKSYKVEETNFFDASKPIVTDCQFEVNDFVFSYDDYLIFNVGNVLGNQLFYNIKDTVRQNDFYIPYKKKYTYSIKIEIPQGYELENSSDLNVKFESNGGKFSAKAAMNKNYLEIETEKNYNFVDYLKKDEKDVKGFLDLATEFTQKKLLLKKKN